ncbi:tRNA-histidine guanylyltransferase 1 [Heterostelium album PN500]|uniref:tRNA(His) guanylyltransferase n=1 Tax=Heterostelium pallidum (strain ATCC 26659 / Pp 5 / PN500) TaxID=670386 RepID=D3AVL0_HETP5|nr:tRNA-histidine guanylyltransferase 1 [Heterostelium album PN500]EFA86333.1 tRNA-histidine guanylyltransferase 1 [Heterostelium album PN500]|eukprot:XP_020438438.1 tRNA-histidine guanylyltransferase 1 [Heterostelium album PN500]
MANSKYEYVKLFEQPDSLLPNVWIVVRVDGRGFHKFTQKHDYAKPNDDRGLNLMNRCALEVCKEFTDIVIAFGESDEYSFVLKKQCTLFERRESKITSSIVSYFSSQFVYRWKEYFGDFELKYPPTFDSRAVCYPSDQNLRDYLSWRQADTHINNLYNTAYWALVLKGGKTPNEAELELRGTLSEQKNEILFSRFAINYNNLPQMYRKGSVIYRKMVAEERIDSRTGQPTTKQKKRPITKRTKNNDFGGKNRKKKGDVDDDVWLWSTIAGHSYSLEGVFLSLNQITSHCVINTEQKDLKSHALFYVISKEYFKMNTNSIKKTDRLINGNHILEFNFVGLFIDRLLVLVYNHLKDKDNITIVGNININNNVIVIPDTVDTEYQLIILASGSSKSKLVSIPMCLELLNKSQSYLIDIQECQYKYNLSYFKQLHIVNNKQYHSITRFPNCNGINDVYLVGYKRRLINYKANQKCYEAALNEIKAMKLLKGNPRFIQIFDHHDDRDNQTFHIITKYSYGGDLSQKYKRLIDQNLIFGETDISKYISQLFNILLDLDKHGIVHCDIKPSNIFIGKSEFSWTLRLGDFGSCKFLDEEPAFQLQGTIEDLQEAGDLIVKSIDDEISKPTICPINTNTLVKATRGTIGYISPEAMNRQYAQSCDIFSIGSTILKLLTCQKKFEALIITNSSDSLAFIKEYYPEYYSTHNLSKIRDFFVDSENNKIKGEYITALLLTQQF